MAANNPRAAENLVPFTGADDPRRANGAPKGSIHLATRIQNLLNDDDFKCEIIQKDGSKLEFKGNPAEAIIKTAFIKAQQGDKQWADWLANNGYGSMLKIEVDDPRKEILEKYLGGDDAGEAEETTS